MIHPFKEILYCCLKKKVVYFYTERSPNQKASQLVKDTICESIKLHGKRTGKISTTLYMFVSFGMGDHYRKGRGVTLTFYLNRFNIVFTTRNFRRQEIYGT